MYRVKRVQDGKKRSDIKEKINTPSTEYTAASHEDYISLESIVRRPKKTLHSKNPYKVKRKKIPLELEVKNNPLDGNTILRICKCEFAEEVLKLDISGKGYKSVYKNDLKNFVNIMEIDATENRLKFEDFDYLLNVNKMNISCNELGMLGIRRNTMPNLQVLDLSFNNLTADECVHLIYFQRLKDLSLVGNWLEYLPEELTSLQFIESLNISHNRFRPDRNASKMWRTLADFRNMKNLYMTGNNIQGIHTDHIVPGDFISLEILDIRDNDIEDQMRIIILRNFMNLKKVYITGNEMCNYPYDYLKEEIETKVGAEVDLVDGS